jgi:hypothetical protein
LTGVTAHVVLSCFVAEFTTRAADTPGRAGFVDAKRSKKIAATHSVLTV